VRGDKNPSRRCAWPVTNSERERDKTQRFPDVSGFSKYISKNFLIGKLLHRTRKSPMCLLVRRHPIPVCVRVCMCVCVQAGVCACVFERAHVLLCDVYTVRISANGASTRTTAHTQYLIQCSLELSEGISEGLSRHELDEEGMSSGAGI